MAFFECNMLKTYGMGKNITSLYNLMSECTHLLPNRNPNPARFTAKVPDTVLHEFLAEAQRTTESFLYCRKLILLLRTFRPYYFRAFAPGTPTCFLHIGFPMPNLNRILKLIAIISRRINAIKCIK
jgi:hypothetical protein